MNATFPSKRDTWIMALLWGGVVISVVSSWAAWHELTGFEARVALPLTVLVCGVLLWFGYGTFYRFEGGVLLIRCGPIRSRVELGEVVGVEPSRNPLSAPACSLDRLHVRTRTGRGVLISPEDKAGFLRELVMAAPHLRVEGDRAVPVEAWAATPGR